MNKMRYARIAVAAVVLVVIFACTFAHVPIGTLCALCPVGFAEVAVGSGSVPWALLPGVLVVLAVVFLLGRVFCSWVCPTSLLRNIFGGRKPHGLTGQTGVCAGCASAAGCASKGKAEGGGADEGAGCESAAGSKSGPPTCPVATTTIEQAASRVEAGQVSTGRVRNNLLAQGIVLAVLLVISLIVHFPVFCLFCPIGLAFGTMFAISRMFITWQPGWELIVFPVMLALELFVLRKWCSAICPLGFFFGLMAKARSRLKFMPRVRVNQSTCIHGEGCEVCATVCPENICAPTAGVCDEEDCTLCLDCREHCPTHSISIGPKSS